MSNTPEHIQGSRKRGWPNTAVQKAIDAFQSGRLDEAQKLARDITNTSPGEEDAWRVLAAVAQRQGRMQEAGQALKDGIAKNPKSATLFTMTGIMLRDIGRLGEAETALRHSLMLDPAQKEAALSLGNLLARSGRIHEAETVFRAACASMPEEPRFPLQLGHAMLTLGNTEFAREAFEKAVESARGVLTRNGDRPQDVSLYVEAATQLGTLLFGEGERLKALDYLYDAVELGGDESVRRQFAQCLATTLPFVQFKPILKPLLVRALSEAWIAPEDLMRQCASQLTLDPEFSAPAERIELIEPDKGSPLLNPDVLKIVADPLLCAMLAAAIVPNLFLERLFTALRRLVLHARMDPDASSARGSEGLLPFSVLLANQCFLTDYAYISSSVEEEIADRLAERIDKACASGAPVSMADLAALASFRALGSLDCAQRLLDREWPPALEPLIQRQLREPLKEGELRKSIPRVTPIVDEISNAVRTQYEENPFPRWAQGQAQLQPRALADWLRNAFPHLPPFAQRYLNPATPLSILVAGCGTGAETIASARRFTNAEVLAIDLSLTSLAYAVRKTSEMGIKNISFAQADILELEGLGQQFDIVECAGVLHHLADTLAGWRVLVRLTKPGGYMLMALYSARGRADLDPAMAFISGRNYGTTPGELRRFRADVQALPNDHPVRKLALLRDDFYNLSMLRDLVFHVRERRFSIPEIAEAIAALGLEFCGFAVEPEIDMQFRDRFGSAANLTSLADWEIFESEFPDTFSAMYHFAVRKPE